MRVSTRSLCLGCCSITYRHYGASTLPLIAGPFADLYPLIMEDPGASGWVTSLQWQVQLCQGLLQLQIMQDSMSRLMLRSDLLNCMHSFCQKLLQLWIIQHALSRMDPECLSQGERNVERLTLSKAHWTVTDCVHTTKQVAGTRAYPF